jgi:zinc transport system substrate-binding protein
MDLLRTSLAGLLLFSVSGCSSGSSHRTIVAAVYPLAWAAERMAQPGWTVHNLAPPGVESHDVELSLEQRQQIEEADVVLYLGPIGFQPQVEAAVAETGGEVVDFAGGLRPTEPVDPHVWLDPSSFAAILSQVRQELCSTDDPCGQRDVARQEGLVAELFDLADRYFEGLRRCRHRTLIVTHEAFGYWEQPFRLQQFGLAGLTPEAEPSAERLAEARRLIEAGEAGAVFYEEHEDARRVAETVAADAGVPALPLSTLESRPAEGDYLSVMEDNLESLREGLGCP